MYGNLETYYGSFQSGFKENYDNLNVSFDLWKGESDAQPYITSMVQEMIDKGLAYESQGAMVVDIQEEGDTKELPPCIVRNQTVPHCMQLPIWQRWWKEKAVSAGCLYLSG